MEFNDYIEISRKALIAGSPELIDDIFSSMASETLFFRNCFITKIPGLILHHYFAPAINGNNKSAIFENWVNSMYVGDCENWNQQLINAIRNGRCGPVARNMVYSLCEHETNTTQNKHQHYP
ncbi:MULTISPECIES: hypothetical protein [Pectobacterium]|uniref:hypothetical protein n=1 Tax=Pectobacterium TaxID=122277 RepID=UPI000D6059FA|nr:MULTISPECIES: hypothetical protein [Pectobacterium]MBA0190684.1 hypothetical protein [Pectobacterium odoriferum]PWD69469.1 hypothetical protein DF215_12390 [Pectobacterium versatile]